MGAGRRVGASGWEGGSERVGVNSGIGPLIPKVLSSMPHVNRVVPRVFLFMVEMGM